MYFVRIDLQQLRTRLMYCTLHDAIDLPAWLHDKGFQAAADGWHGTDDSVSHLSCSEILFSEHSFTPVDRQSHRS